MPIPNAVKVGIGVAALLGAGFFVWKNFSQTDENDVTFGSMPRYFSCEKGHDFTVTSAEMRQISAAHNNIMVCPQCEAPASEKFKCPKCSKFLDFVGHGQQPKTCSFCNAKLD